MKNKFTEVSQKHPEFNQFMESLDHMANYFMATHPGVEHIRVDAIRLCLAYAFEAGVKVGQEKSDL